MLLLAGGKLDSFQDKHIRACKNAERHVDFRMILNEGEAWLEQSFCFVGHVADSPRRFVFLEHLVLAPENQNNTLPIN